MKRSMIASVGLMALIAAISAQSTHAQNLADTGQAPESSATQITLPDLPDNITANFSDIEPVILDLPALPEFEIAIELQIDDAKQGIITTASLPPSGLKTAQPDQSARLAAEPTSALVPQDAPLLHDLPLPPELPVVIRDAPSSALQPPVQIGMLQIADRLQVLASIPRLGELERKAIAAFYRERDHKSLWLDGDVLNPSGKDLIRAFEQASINGLNNADYALSGIFLAGGSSASSEALADLELRLSGLAVLYARDARGGRVDPRRLSKLMTPKLDLPTASVVLNTLQNAPDVGAKLSGFNPAQPGYLALRAKLAELRGSRYLPETRPASEPMVRIPAGPALRVGMRDERVPLIRARLNLGPAEELVFDRPLSVAVAEFQRGAGLPVNGIAGRATIDAMQTSSISRIEADLVANMERWRWLPSEMGTRHVFVNIPEFQVRLISDGATVLESKVVVGKPETATPVFSDMMDHLVINPSWFVPPSILKKEFIPGLAADPNYAAKRGFEVTRRGNNITVRQPPGERNALGNIKFMFPNDHAVYLHDTPSRHLFNTTRRAYSHGCVRVDQPFRLATKILEMGTGEEWTEARLRRMIGSGERPLRLMHQLPVHLAYFTQVANADGTLSSYEDIYGFHRLVRQALGFGS
jgi:L,D-transpeptidase YcbB